MGFGIAIQQGLASISCKEAVNILGFAATWSPLQLLSAAIALHERPQTRAQTSGHACVPIKLTYGHGNPNFIYFYYVTK